MKTLDTEQLEAMLDSDGSIILVNVLTRDAFEKEHIPGSVNVPLQGPGFLEDMRTEAPDKDEKIVVYCADEECDASEEAARKLEEAGYRDVYDYAGGMEAWREADQPVASL